MSEGRCNCATHGSAALCPYHTQADYEAAKAARPGYPVIEIEQATDIPTHYIEIRTRDGGLVKRIAVDLNAQSTNNPVPEGYGEGQRALAIAAQEHAPVCPWDCDTCRED